ncbi:butyrophilin-like protein 9 [Elgaria multicarinata webbii]|uniref:butyrophilin-like protein 9 n=1 Tax=Elgaria multicarinata webbii TaxID=159646 RepID=UPI002FCD01FC
MRVNFDSALRKENYELSSSPSGIGKIGENVVLPCHISLGKQPQNTEVHWKKIGDNHVNNIYQFKALTDQEIFGQGYRDRAVLTKNGMASGNVSLMLKKVQVSDEGTYSCIVKSIDWTADTQTILHVAAVGNVSIEILGPEGDGIKVACRSAGWFPKPELHWLAKNWQNYHQCESKQDHEQLFSVSSDITILRDTGEITCLVHESRLQMKQNFTFFLSRNVFPYTSPWLPAFWILFILAFLGVAVVAYGKFKESKKKHLEEEEKMLQECQARVIESETQDLRRMLEFRKARSYLVHIQLDPNCKHSELSVSSDCSSVHHQCPSPGPAVMPNALIIVGTEGFENGSQYWEVKVEDKPNWELGVLTEGTRNQLKAGKLDAPKEDQHWSLRKLDGIYRPKEADCALQGNSLQLRVVGIYLDRIDSYVSFYDVKGTKAIVSIPVNTSGKLYPFFSPGCSDGGDSETPLTICQDKGWDFPEQLEAIPK